MTLDTKFTAFLASADGFRIPEIDEAIEAHSRQIDMLRLLRQIVELREEGEVVGEAVQSQAAAPPTIPIQAAVADDTPTAPLPSVVVESEPKPSTARPSKKWRCPSPGTVADRIWQLLRNRGELKTGVIALELGIKDTSSISSVLRAWEGRIFERVSHGSWRLIAQDAPQAVLTHREEMEASEPASEPIAEQPAQAQVSMPDNREPLNGNAFRVLAYLQRSQPATPYVIAADLKISLSEVVMILQGHKCFRMNGKGWMLNNASREPQEASA